MKQPKRKKILRIVAFILLLLTTNTVFTSELYRLWEVKGKRIESLRRYDCGILLCGMASFNKDLTRLSLGAHGDRIWQTLNLYHGKRIEKILITGDDGDLIDKGLNEASQLKKDLIAKGIPPKDILIEKKSKNTHENALFTKQFLEKSYPHLTDNILITSSVHMKRAEACFMKIGMKVTSFSTNHETGSKRGYTIDQIFIPDVNNLELWDLLIKEAVGYVVYDMVGYI